MKYELSSFTTSSILLGPSSSDSRARLPLWIDVFCLLTNTAEPSTSIFTDAGGSKIPFAVSLLLAVCRLLNNALWMGPAALDAGAQEALVSRCRLGLVQD